LRPQVGELPPDAILLGGQEFSCSLGVHVVVGEFWSPNETSATRPSRQGYVT
jgi:hypothetical protein